VVREGRGEGGEGRRGVGGGERGRGMLTEEGLRSTNELELEL